MTQSLVKQAADFLSAGNYIDAQRVYQQAGERYGYELFEANIKLCRKHIDEDFNVVRAAGKSPSKGRLQTVPAAFEAQLKSMQEMLEYYYIRCQELEAQLLDAKS